MIVVLIASYVGFVAMLLFMIGSFGLDFEGRSGGASSPFDCINRAHNPLEPPTPRDVCLAMENWALTAIQIMSILAIIFPVLLILRTLDILRFGRLQ